MYKPNIPDLRTVAFAGAIWLVALAAAFALQTTDSASISVAWRGIIVGLTLFGAFHLARIGISLGKSADNLIPVVRDTTPRVDREDKAA